MSTKRPTRNHPVTVSLDLTTTDDTPPPPPRDPPPAVIRPRPRLDVNSTSGDGVDPFHSLSSPSDRARQGFVDEELKEGDGWMMDRRVGQVGVVDQGGYQLRRRVESIDSGFANDENVDDVGNTSSDDDRRSIEGDPPPHQYDDVSRSAGLSTRDRVVLGEVKLTSSGAAHVEDDIVTNDINKFWDSDDEDDDGFSSDSSGIFEKDEDFEDRQDENHVHKANMDLTIDRPLDDDDMLLLPATEQPFQRPPLLSSRSTSLLRDAKPSPIMVDKDHPGVDPFLPNLSTPRVTPPGEELFEKVSLKPGVFTKSPMVYRWAMSCMCAFITMSHKVTCQLAMEQWRRALRQLTTEQKQESDGRMVRRPSPRRQSPPTSPRKRNSPQKQKLALVSTGYVDETQVNKLKEMVAKSNKRRDVLKERLKKTAVRFGRDKLVMVVERRQNDRFRLCFHKWKLYACFGHVVQKLKSSKLRVKTITDKAKYERDALADAQHRLTQFKLLFGMHAAFETWKRRVIEDDLVEEARTNAKYQLALLGQLEMVKSKFIELNYKDEQVTEAAVERGRQVLDRKLQVLDNVLHSMNEGFDVDTSVLSSTVVSTSL